MIEGSYIEEQAREGDQAVEMQEIKLLLVSAI
jgi:hypothetical protein